MFPKIHGRHAPSKVYNVVADVDRYCEFVPWVLYSQRVGKEEKEVNAEGKVVKQMLLGIGFKGGLFDFQEKFLSEVTLVKDMSVCADAAENKLFHFLRTNWKFAPGPTPNSCWVDFETSFSFRSELHSYAVQLFWSEVVKKLVDSFEARCNTLSKK